MASNKKWQLSLFFEDQRNPMTMTGVRVLNVLKGDAGLKDENIRILNMYDNERDKEKHFILFLNPKTDRYGDDVYLVVGLYQGMLNVDKHGKVYYDGYRPEDGSTYFLDEQFAGKTLGEAIEDICGVLSAKL